MVIKYIFILHYDDLICICIHTHCELIITTKVINVILHSCFDTKSVNSGMYFIHSIFQFRDYISCAKYGYGRHPVMLSQTSVALELLIH